MEILYQGADITGEALVHACRAVDTSGDRCDSLDITFENATGWNRWEPQEGDEIIVRHGDYETGIMYLTAVMPEEGRYRMLATALPCAAREKVTASYAGKTLEDILRAVSMKDGMGFQIWGLDAKTPVTYIERNDECGAAFLQRLFRMEGALFKCVNGLYTAIGLNWAQARAASRSLTVTSKQSGARYRRDGRALRSLTVKSPHGAATAKDMDIPTSYISRTILGLPARNGVEAGRWARGLLLDANRKCEMLTLDTAFDAGMTAGVRVDIDGGTDADGEWIVETAEHDFMNAKTTATMRRCIASIQ